ncbi:arylsulfatase [Compostimonas suwonensis]|uniref:Arylsulfatase n=1 Tax=Compostimonas suwonensis TaxID=1048394 RepID=A0A2M9C3F3_9MICO|nr:arylsulfatase [Compostimonas suwonensis]PJJ65032.1 arylsulfatase [Compostimonas suwonensis]
MPKKFSGVINLDIRDSVPDWTPYIADKAPEGSPNVLIILFDDTGLAAWSPYGGRISMPTMDRLAANGLTYTQWHTTALCSPTRSSFLTGRTHHQNGFASISEGAMGFPGSNSHIPFENAFLAEVLREKGWNTFWVGKNHNVPIDEWHAGATKRNWPLARGFDRFYGFLGGETNQWYPDLTEDNHAVDQPYLPDDGYHLSKDLADKAIEFIRDSRQTAPEKPWYMFFCPGANHAPHHAPQEWIDKYKGQFDDGYEAYRDWVLPRMVERGILPEGTDITEINPMPDGTFAPADSVRPWESLSDEEKALFSRMAEVYAGFSSYTDYETGRIIDYLEESGQLDNTIVMFAADNGASGEGSPDGSVNEGKFFNGIPDDIEQNLSMIDKLGSPDTYNHYPTGWAMAFSTPFRMFKRYSYQGGVADPLVISWPAGITARGEVRNQYHHVTDIVPTLLEALGVEFPEVVNGYEQTPLPGVSMAYTFDAEPDAPTTKTTQYYEMLGTRAIWHEGWKAVAVHGPTSDIGNFDKDVWQLFNTDEDRSEANDLAEQYPEKVKEFVDLWFQEAEKYNVLPLNDLSASEILKMEIPAVIPPSGTYTYYSGASDVPERMAANVHGVSYTIVVELTVDEPDAEGVLFAQGSRFGGHSLFVKNRKLWYAYNFLGIPPETQIVSEVELTPGSHIVGLEFSKESVGQYGVSVGTAKLYIDDEVVAEGPLTTMSGHFSLCGEGLGVGRDGGDPVSKEYSHGFDFRGGTIVKAQVHVGDDAFIDMERMLAAAMARD